MVVLSTICSHIKVAELNTLSDGKGITCIGPDIFFFFFFFFKCKFEKFIMVVNTMCLHINVAELNTLSDGKGITGIRQ